MTTSNTYEGRTIKILTRSERFPIYFVDIKNPEGTSDPIDYTWSGDSLERAERTIDNVVGGDGLAKFVVAFSKSFVVYSWGDDETPDFNLIKQGEWALLEGCTQAKEGVNNPIFCPLENLIKAQETKIWCSPNVRTISEYYRTAREPLAITLTNADKEFS